jgi:hypothetical protein
MFSDEKETADQHTRTKHKMFSDQKEPVHQHAGENSTILFPIYHKWFKIAAQSTFVSLAPSINFVAKKYVPRSTNAFLFKLRAFERQKCAGCWGYVVRCWSGLTTDKGKIIRRGCYSFRARVLAVVASNGDKCINTAHCSIDKEILHP